MKELVSLQRRDQDVRIGLICTSCPITWETPETCFDLGPVGAVGTVAALGREARFLDSRHALMCERCDAVQLEIGRDNCET